jgi:hypothetical protein
MFAWVETDYNARERTLKVNTQSATESVSGAMPHHCWRSLTRSVVLNPTIGPINSSTCTHRGDLHGRFAQTDPSGQEANTYAYAESSPVMKLDPDGTSALSTAVEVLGAILTGNSLGEALAGASAKRTVLRTSVSIGERTQLTGTAATSSCEAWNRPASATHYCECLTPQRLRRQCMRLRVTSSWRSIPVGMV